MKSILFTISILMLWFHGFGQMKNEFGIGIGSIGYSNADGQPTMQGMKITFLKPRFLSLGVPLVWHGGGIQNITNSYSLPAFYYTRRLDKHLSFSSMYQYSNAKGYLFDFMYGSSDDKDRTFSLKNHCFQFGFVYSIFKTRTLNPYVGLGFDVDTYFGKYTSFYNGKPAEMLCSEGGTFTPALSIGLSARCCKRFSIRYDASAATDLAQILFKPVNRLSINYHF